MADSGTPVTDGDHSAAVGRRYLLHFEEDTLRERPLWIRVIVEFIGAAVMAMIYAWGPLSGLHINPAVTFAFAGRQVFPVA